jgi:acetoin:2,6-dichlorophenolindophenol oxidoreductase subunit beta
VFAHVPGLKVVCPGTVQDAYDLLRASVADPNPVLVFEHKALYRSLKAPLVRGRRRWEFGRARVARPGRHLTLVTYGGMLPRCLEVAEGMAGGGSEVEVVDLRSLVPLDMRTVVESAQRTGHLLIVHEAVQDFGAGAEIAARISDELFDQLLAPVRRLGTPSVPMPFSPDLERGLLPGAAAIASAAQALRTES